MNMNTIINMLIRTVTRMFLRKGINSAIGMATKGAGKLKKNKNEDVNVEPSDQAPQMDVDKQRTRSIRKY